LRVALLTDSEAFAGTERHMLDLAHVLRQIGVDAELACPSRGDMAAMAGQENLPVFGLRADGLRALLAINTIRGKLRSGQWDLVHAHNGRAALIAAIGHWLARRGTLIATQHFIDPARTKRRGWRASLARLVHRWVDGQTAGIIAISEAVKAALLTRDAIPPGKVHVAINGIRDPAAKPLVSAEAVRATFGVPDAAPLIVCVCRLEPEKSVEILVRAMPEVLAAFPDAVCLIGGSGSEQARISAEIQRLGLERSVRLLGFQKDPHSLMTAATVFVLPSRAEPFGLALVEAMALRRPCVATRAGGPLEIIIEDVSGLLVAPDDPAALAIALSQLLAEPDLRERLGASARARYEQRFTVGQMGETIKAVYLATAVPKKR
jgi:glycosyltransferase involved in cell wall biosynthesis